MRTKRRQRNLRRQHRAPEEHPAPDEVADELERQRLAEDSRPEPIDCVLCGASAAYPAWLCHACELKELEKAWDYVPPGWEEYDGETPPTGGR